MTVGHRRASGPATSPPRPSLVYFEVFLKYRRLPSPSPTPVLWGTRGCCPPSPPACVCGLADSVRLSSQQSVAFAHVLRTCKSVNGKFPQLNARPRRKGPLRLLDAENSCLPRVASQRPRDLMSTGPGDARRAEPSEAASALALILPVSVTAAGHARTHTVSGKRTWRLSWEAGHQVSSRYSTPLSTLLPRLIRTLTVTTPICLCYSPHSLAPYSRPRHTIPSSVYS